MNFGKYLEELIIRRGLSLRELGKRAGISHSFLSLVINGKRGTPSPEQLLKLAPHLEIDYMELMKNAGYVTEDIEFDKEELEFLDKLDSRVPIVELLKLNPTIDDKEVTETELELAIDVIRSLRKTQTPR
ncbi:MAG: helix-turn-helix domain-containing protein [Bacillota bacterium]